MLILLTILLGLLSFTAHEMGHYEAMRRCGIRIREVSLLGFPFPFVSSLRWTRGETTWSIHPLLLGAYVRPYTRKEMGKKDGLQSVAVDGEDEDDEGEQVSSLGLKDQLYIYANGPLANVVFALALLTLIYLIICFQTGNWRSIVLALLSGTGAGALWWARRYVALVVPVLSLPILCFIGFSIFSHSPQQALEGGSGGPVAVFHALTGAKTLIEALLLPLNLNLGLALINLLPLMPLDGGQMVSSIIKTWRGEKPRNIYILATIPFFLLMLLYFLGLDAVRIWLWL